MIGNLPSGDEASRQMGQGSRADLLADLPTSRGQIRTVRASRRARSAEEQLQDGGIGIA